MAWTQQGQGKLLMNKKGLKWHKHENFEVCFMDHSSHLGVQIYGRKRIFCCFWNGADIWRFTSLHVDSVYAESFFDCALGKKFNLVFIPFRPLIRIPSFFILFCPLKCLKEIFWSYLEFKVKISVHFMLSIRWVRLGVRWAYAEWDLVYTEHTQSETESAKTAISGPFQKQNKKVFKSCFILLLGT